MRNFYLIGILFSFPLIVSSQSSDKLKRTVDSLKKEKEAFISNYQSRLIVFDKKLDSLNEIFVDALEKEARIKYDAIESNLWYINDIIGNGINVELTQAVNLSTSASLNPSGLRIPAKQIVKLTKRSDIKSFAVIKHNAYVGYVPVYHLKLPAKIDVLEKKLKELMGDEYYPVAPPKSTTNTTPSTSKPQSYSSPSPTYSSPKTSECSSVQCSGTTKKGDRCRNTTKNCNGRCYLH
jgi:hypothetical protein